LERHQIEVEELQSILNCAEERCCVFSGIASDVQDRYDELVLMVNRAVVYLRNLIIGLSKTSGESGFDGSLGGVSLTTGVVNLRGDTVLNVELQRMLSVLGQLCCGMQKECERFENQSGSFHNLMDLLGVGDFSSSSLFTLLGERSEVMKRFVSEVDGNADVKVGLTSLDKMLTHYSDIQTAVVSVVAEDTNRAVHLAQDQIVVLRRDLDVTRRSMDELSLLLKGPNTPESHAAGTSLEDEYGNLVDSLREEQKSVVAALEALVVSVGGDGATVIRDNDGVPFKKSVQALVEECRRAAQAFASLKSMLENSGDVLQPQRESRASSVSGSMNNSSCSEYNVNRLSLPMPLPLVHGYDDVISYVVCCLSSVMEGRERNVRLLEELRRALDTATLPTPTASPLPTEGLASHKQNLLLPVHELLDGARSPRTTDPPPIVQEVRQHLAAQAAEVSVLRSAVLTSVEKLGGTPNPSTAKSQAIAKALVELAKETGDSIAEVRLMLDPSAVHRGPVRLRDLLRQLEVKMQESEAGKQHARELAESIMHINDPSFSLTATRGRSLTSRPKPPRVGSSYDEESLSLNRSFCLSTPGQGNSICNDNDLSNASRQINKCVAGTGQETSRVSLGTDVNIENVLSNPITMQESIQNIRAKLINIRQLTNCCSAAICMMGGEVTGEIPLEALPVRILQKAQEFHEVLRLTQDIWSTLEGNDKTDDSVPTALVPRIKKISDTLKRLHSENAALHEQGIAVEKQKSFLLQDFDRMRQTLGREKEQIKKECDDLVNERNALKNVIERAKDEEEASDAALKQARQELASLQLEFNQLRSKCDQQQVESMSLRAMGDDMRLSMVGLEEAALTIRRSTAAVSERIRSIVRKLPDDSSTAKETNGCDVSDRQEKMMREDEDEDEKEKEKDNNEEKKDEKGRETSLTRSSGEGVEVASVSAARLLAESGSELRRCSWNLIRIEHSVQGVTQLREWLQKVSAWTKETIARDEAWMRLILRDVCRNGANLLAEKSRLERGFENRVQLLQRRLDEMCRDHEKERESERQNWRDMEVVHNENEKALQRRLDSLQQQKQEQEVARYEAERQAANFRSQSETAMKEVSQLHETVSALKKELGKVRSRLKSSVKTTAESAVMTEPFESMYDCLPAIFALMAAVGVNANNGDGYDDYYSTNNISGTGVSGGTVQLKELLPLALERARQLSEDTAQCRALLLEQLALFGSDDEAASMHQHQDEHQQLPELIERHSKSIGKFLDQRTELIGKWQGALDDLSRLQREFNKNEEDHYREMHEMELHINDLRGMVQRKLEADKIAEENMKEIEQTMDQLLADVSKYSAEEAVVRRHVQELRRLIRSQLNRQRNAFMRT
ncbi:uncharacterized protein TM35_000491310, partial [Trypanosoma theileri]